MTSSTSVFSETLQEITNTKLEELSKRRASFEEAKTLLLNSLTAEDDAINRLVTLSNGIKKCFNIRLDNAGNIIHAHVDALTIETELRNLDQFLEQVKYDPSVSSQLLHDWEQSLVRHLEVQSNKYQYAALYGQLITEWTSNNQNPKSATTEDIEMGNDPREEEASKEFEARVKWETSAFEPANINHPALVNYLDGIFGLGDEDTKHLQQALAKLREEVHAFETTLSMPKQFNNDTLRWVIRGLCSSDQVSNQEKEVLRDFLANPSILTEIADVLNMRMAALDTWNWTTGSSLTMEMQRMINGTYAIRIHKDLLQAIFLQYLGVKWNVFFKEKLRRFLQTPRAWKSRRDEIPKSDIVRLEYYLGPLRCSPSIEAVQSGIYRERYFLAQLIGDVNQSIDNTEGNEEVDYQQVTDMSRKRNLEGYGMAPRKRVASHAVTGYVPSSPNFSPSSPIRTTDSDDEQEEEREAIIDSNQAKVHNPTILKQRLLHLLSTDMSINTQLHGEMTAFHCVFKDWTALLPHETVRTILGYFGVSEAWLAFFTKFLEVPSSPATDGEPGSLRKVRRGAPSSHMLSSVFGETTLFCLDLAVNRSTGGNVLWRVHDDMWFWSRDHNTAIQAWKAVERFSTITGTELSPATQGTVRVSREPGINLPIDDSLPKGEIRWGLLKLSPTSGRFEIDLSLLDAQAIELERQLKSRKGSILEFIHTWNAFAGTFITSNCGQVANCFGREHVDSMLSAHQRIQSKVFSTWIGEDGGNVASIADFLKKTIRARFGIEQIPDGYLYFPMDLGGLDLKSSFIPLLQIRNQTLESPRGLMEKFKDTERIAYFRAKEDFENGNVGKKPDAMIDPDWKPESAHDRQNFLSFEQYTQYRDFFTFKHYPEDMRLHQVFRKLMWPPDPESVKLDASVVQVALQQLKGQSTLSNITTRWQSMEPYWRWVAAMYGNEIVSRFGGFNIVDSGLLPMGMVSLFKERRINWLAKGG